MRGFCVFYVFVVGTSLVSWFDVGFDALSTPYNRSSESGISSVTRYNISALGAHSGAAKPRYGSRWDEWHKSRSENGEATMRLVTELLQVR